MTEIKFGVQLERPSEMESIFPETRFNRIEHDSLRATAGHLALAANKLKTNDPNDYRLGRIENGIAKIQAEGAEQYDAQPKLQAELHGEAHAINVVYDHAEAIKVDVHVNENRSAADYALAGHSQAA